MIIIRQWVAGDRLCKCQGKYNNSLTVTRLQEPPHRQHRRKEEQRKVTLSRQPALHETHSYRQVRKDFVLTAPTLVRATRGSCLVIPCSYILPKAYPKLNTYHGLWKKGSKGLNVASSQKNYPVHQDYQRRTSFLGPVLKKNCTWMLAGVQDSDAALYFFRMELPGHHSYSWITQPTKVQVVDAKFPDVTLTGGGAGRDTAFCSVVHSCPQNPPALTWNPHGTGMSGSTRLDDWQWVVYNVLQLSSEHNITMELRCTVTYHGGQRLFSTVRYG